MSDMVNQPPHYKHPNPDVDMEAIEISRKLSSNLGAAANYLWRAGRKGPAKEDLQKSIWHIQNEIATRGDIENFDFLGFCDYRIGQILYGFAEHDISLGSLHTYISMIEQVLGEIEDAS